MVLNFTVPRYALLFLINSEIYIVHVINCEWSRFVSFPLRMFCLRYKLCFPHCLSKHIGCIIGNSMISNYKKKFLTLLVASRWCEKQTSHNDNLLERERESVIGGLKYQWNSFSFATVFQQYYMIGDRKWGHAYHNLKRTSFVELIVNGLICVNFNMKKKVGVAISTRR